MLPYAKVEESALAKLEQVESLAGIDNNGSEQVINLCPPCIEKILQHQPQQCQVKRMSQPPQEQPQIFDQYQTMRNI
jgi:hypothetical protein